MARPDAQQPFEPDSIPIRQAQTGSPGEQKLHLGGQTLTNCCTGLHLNTLEYFKLRNPSTWKLQLKAISTAPHGAQNTIAHALNYGCPPSSDEVFRPTIGGKVPLRLLLGVWNRFEGAGFAIAGYFHRQW
jgi:hypothetical protein